MSKARFRVSRRNRAVIGGLIIAMGSIYALAVSYNIPRAELLWFLVGSVLVLLAAMIAALFLVLIVKGLSLMWRRLLPGTRPENGEVSVARKAGNAESDSSSGQDVTDRR